MLWLLTTKLQGSKLSNKMNIVQNKNEKSMTVSIMNRQAYAAEH